MSDTRRAALAVADQATDADDCRQLLDMLGLLEHAARPKQRKGRPPVDHGHGHPNTYRKGCRCEACRDAHTRYQAEMRARRIADPTSADRAGHGSASTYMNHGCRCEACTTANTEKVRRRREARRAKAVTS